MWRRFCQTYPPVQSLQTAGRCVFLCVCTVVFVLKWDFNTPFSVLFFEILQREKKKKWVYLNKSDMQLFWRLKHQISGCFCGFWTLFVTDCVSAVKLSVCLEVKVNWFSVSHWLLIENYTDMHYQRLYRSAVSLVDFICNVLLIRYMLWFVISDGLSFFI